MGHKDSRPFPFPLFKDLFSPGSREPLSTKQQFSLDSIASCIENDHLNNSEDGSAIKRDKKSGRKEQFFTINYLPIVVSMGTS
jgi:hypothetical protein